MKLSTLSILSALLVTFGANADWKSNLSSINNEFKKNLNTEGYRAPLKNASQFPKAPRKAHFNLNASDICKKLPKISLMNDQIANAIVVDAGALMINTAQSIHKAEAKPAAQDVAIVTAKNVVKTAAKTYTAEQLVAALLWTANKIQEKTGIKAPAALKPVLENEYVAWLTGVAVKTVARAAADTAINLAVKNVPSFPKNGGSSSANTGASQGSK